MKQKTIYIRDDLGMAWSFDGERVYSILAELEMAEHGRDTSDGQARNNGYPCHDWEEALEILNEAGYITGFTEPSIAEMK